jgi:hypothetical protein
MKSLTSEIQKPIRPDSDEWWAEGASVHYSDAYNAAKAELKIVIAEQQKLEKKKLFLRKALANLAELCESHGSAVDRNSEATNILDRSSLAAETKNVLQSLHPEYVTPHSIKEVIEKLGHNLSKYRNPQAAIHTVLKRMAEAGEAIERFGQIDNKQVYCYRPPHALDAADSKAYEALGLAGRVRRIMEKSAGVESLPLEQITRRLADTGFDLKTRVNPRADIKIVLEALIESGEVSDNGEEIYTWEVKPKRRAAKKPRAS